MISSLEKTTTTKQNQPQQNTTVNYAIEERCNCKGKYTKKALRRLGCTCIGAAMLGAGVGAVRSTFFGVLFTAALRILKLLQLNHIL